MGYTVLENTIVYKEDGKVFAEIAYPPIAPGVVDICSTHVDPSLRGKGYADELVKRAAEELRRTKRRAEVSCSYAEIWFKRHPDYADVLAKK